MNDIVKKAIIGSAVGDALGVPYEFKTRKDMDICPAHDMIGFGTHRQPPGTWSDDTSMTLATVDALINGLNFEIVMKNFASWLYNGNFSPGGAVFDAGGTTQYAINRFLSGKLKAIECGDDSERSNGNGSLMRIMPFVLYCHFNFRKIQTMDKMMTIIHDGSALTHSHNRAKIACGIYGLVILEVVKKPTKKSILRGIRKAYKFYSKIDEYREEINHFARLFSSKFIKIPRDEIRSSGYVIDSLEAAIWCALTTSSYADSVLKAVNLGGDTDTIASITGGITGLLYGVENIPNEWKENLLRMDYIEYLCDLFTKV